MSSVATTTLPAASEHDVDRPLRTLVVTNLFPTSAAPTTGTFVADQVASLRTAGVAVELLHVPRREGGPGVYRDLARRAVEVVERTSPDVVHVMYGGVMADVVTRTVRNVPVLVSFCGTDLLGGRGRGLVHGLSRRYGVVASRRAAARAAGVVVKSRNLSDALPASVDRSRVWIVPNGVNLERFQPRDKEECRSRLGWTTTRTNVLFPGAPERPEKRFELAQACIAQLRAERHDVGLKALAGVDPEAVATWLNAADVVLLTSAHEGSPNVVKEALACNVPVVSVDVGDVSERLAGIEGCAVAEPTASDLARNVLAALAHGRLKTGRERVAELSLERVAAELARIYAMLAGSRGLQRTAT
jgi:glycosyltransferase involved in cell wall biosynthesis